MSRVLCALSLALLLPVVGQAAPNTSCPSSNPAVYYVRAVENPTCRYSQWDCIRLPKAERPAACEHEFFSASQQERA